MTRRRLRSGAKAGPQAAIVAALFRLLAAKPWREVTIASVARAAKIPLAEVLAVAPSRPHLLALLLRDLGRETVRHYRPERAQQSTRERLFEVVMSWFEVLNPRKKAARNLFGDLAKEPFTLIALRGEVLRTSEMLLALAEADAGPFAFFRATSLAAVIARAVPVWLDDGADLDRTMARVDRGLRRLEWLL